MLPTDTTLSPISTTKEKRTFRVANNGVLFPHVKAAFIRRLKIPASCIPPMLYLKGRTYPFSLEDSSVVPKEQAILDIIISFQVYTDGTCAAIGRIYTARTSSSS